MDHTPVDVKHLKSLEDLKECLVTSIVSLMTLYNYQVRAIEIGIMKEDMNVRANTVAWDIRRLIQLYKEQLIEVLDLLPDSLNAEKTIEQFLKKLKRDFNKKKREETCDT